MSTKVGVVFLVVGDELLESKLQETKINEHNIITNFTLFSTTLELTEPETKNQKLKTEFLFLNIYPFYT